MKALPKPALRAIAALAALLALAAIYILLSGGGGDPVDADGEPAIPVSVLKVSISDHYVIARGFTGRAIARRRADLGFERDGKLAEILVDNGAVVKKGQLLARMDDARLAAERFELEARINEADANLVVADKTLLRTRPLFNQGHVTEQRLDDATAQADAAKASLARARAALKRIDVDLEKSTLHAPFDGVIERRLVDEGAVISAGATVFRFIESGRLEAEVGMPLSFANAMKPGDHLPLRTGAGEVLFAEVMAVVPVVRGETRTALVTLRMSGEPTRSVVDGSLVTAEVNDRIASPGFWIPIRALTADVRGLWRVYKVSKSSDGADRVVFENVQMLHSEKDRAFVSGTVNDGDLLIDGGVARVVPGRKVEVVRVNTIATPLGDGA